MHRVMYIGPQFETFQHSVHNHEIKAYHGNHVDKISAQQFEIVVIDGASFDESPLAHASHLKSEFRPSAKVWLYIHHPSIRESIESCYAEGFDDALVSLDRSNLEMAMAKASLLYSQRSHYLEQLDMAQDMARTAMSNSGELGALVRLLTNLVKTDCFNDMGIELVEWFDEFQLNICIQIRSGKEQFEYASSSIVQPIETEILSKGVNGDRIVELGKIYLFNEAHISILIKNMPLNDPDKVGRLRDHIAVIIHTSESIINSIQLKINEKKNSTDLIASGLDEFKQYVKSMNEEMFEYINTSKNQFKTFTSRMQADLLGLDLSDAQYEQLVRLLEEYEGYDEDFNEMNLDIENKITVLEHKIRIALP